MLKQSVQHSRNRIIIIIGVTAERLSKHPGGTTCAVLWCGVIALWVVALPGGVEINVGRVGRHDMVFVAMLHGPGYPFACC